MNVLSQNLRSYCLFRDEFAIEAGVLHKEGIYLVIYNIAEIFQD